ncbi:hypothetical protein [Muribaculum intestinale]|uniref:hypothetical protein n=1 Tax=Muribaculum intestinale TaxID=1796646 RepID=UPI0025B75BB0|nr:hypothetical protein [Muribaculum intestinale]
MNLQLIKRYGEQYPGGLRKLAVDAGMSEGNLHRCIRNNKIQASDLEALSRLLGVEIGIFFTDDAKSIETRRNSQIGDVSWLYEKIALLEQRIKDKDELIEILKQKR